MPELTTSRISERLPDYRCTGLPKVLGALLSFLPIVISGPAQAHIKWFASYDLTKPPLPIQYVLNSCFILFFLASMTTVYVLFAADRWAVHRGYLIAHNEKLRSLDEIAILVMRWCGGLFFVALWFNATINHNAIFLTPELRTNLGFIAPLQLFMGLCALSALTTPLIGMGILLLYGYAIRFYGMFHMADYVIFLGIAYFFLVAPNSKGFWRKSSFVVLYAATGATLFWASIEKFGYAAWTYPLLNANPDMLMGLQPETYMTLAGFVEFNVVFLMLGFSSLTSRLTAGGLMLVFLLAIAKFGVIDAIGHLMIIGILTVMVIRGPCDARTLLFVPDKSPWVSAYFMTALYCSAFVMSFLIYYVSHGFFYGK